MPRTPRQEPPRQLTRKQLSRQERESRTQRWIIISTAAVLALVLFVLGWGALDQFVLRPRRPVATVAGEAIPSSRYEKLLRFREWEYRGYINQLTQQQNALLADMQEGDESDFLVQYISQQIQALQMQLSGLPSSVLEEMVDDTLIRQEAARRGITVTDEEVQTALEERFGYFRNPPTPIPSEEAVESESPTVAVDTEDEKGDAPEGVIGEGEEPAGGDNITEGESASEPTPTPWPTEPPMTAEECAERYDGWVQVATRETGFSEREYRELLTGELYRQKMEEQIRESVPAAAEQVHARHILVGTREEAEQVLERLQGGEDFQALAAELSLDTGSNEMGGDLQWFPRGVMDPAFEEAAFALQPGEISEPVEATYGFHIIAIEGHEEERDVDPYILQQLQQMAVQEWLTELRDAAGIEYH